MAATHSLGNIIEAHISSGEQANNPVNLKVIQRASLNWHCLSPLDNECVNMNLNGRKVTSQLVQSSDQTDEAVFAGILKTIRPRLQNHAVLFVSKVNNLFSLAVQISA
jgi:hypothetical protein